MPTINAAGLEIVKAFEGCMKSIGGGNYTTYYCPANVLTIGYGHTNLGGVPPRINPGDVWSKADCDNALKADMRKFEAHVARTGPEVAEPNQFSALVSWAFNTGGPASSSVWKYARAGDVEETKVRLRRWNMAGGRVLAGLVRRRDSEAELFGGDVKKALSIAGVHGGLPMPQKSDTPKPPASEVIKKTKKETAAAGAGGTMSGTAASAEKPTSFAGTVMTYAAIGVGLAILIVGVILAVRKGREFIKDWA
jgi:lysozyme